MKDSNDKDTYELSGEPSDAQLLEIEEQSQNVNEILNKQIDDALRHINYKKKIICDAIIDGDFYNVFEYDLKDLSIIDNMIRLYSSNDANVIITMIKLAIPDCSVDDIQNLTQSESSELLAMIQTAAGMRKIMNSSSTVH